MRKSLRISIMVLPAIALGIGVVANWHDDPSPVQLVADKVVIHKARRQLHLLKDKDTVRTYRIALGRNPIGPKRTEGDGKTPEGSYVLDYRKLNSSFHRALHISYPNAADRAQAQRRAVSAGGLIMIHGLPNGLGWLGMMFNWRDWTDGCVAVTDSDIEQIWDAVPDGTPVVLLP